MMNMLLPLSRSEKCYLRKQKNILEQINQQKQQDQMKQFRDPVYNQPDPSITSLQYTYAFSKYSCVSWVYPLHIIFAYLVVISGFLAIISRVIHKLTPYHVTFGRWYLIWMFWCMASSSLIHNAGLPMPVIVSFLYLLFSITIGWNAIRVHIDRIKNQISERVNIRLNSPRLTDDKFIDIKKIENEQKQAALSQKTFLQRLFSLKMVHGVLFTFSWSQMLGRTIVTNPFTSFSGCWTYPAYKPVAYDSTQQTVFPLDSVSTPPFPMKQSLFIVMITVPTVIIILLVAAISTYFFYRKDMKVKEVAPTILQPVVVVSSNPNSNQ